jgi:hypothetical protein
MAITSNPLIMGLLGLGQEVHQGLSNNHSIVVIMRDCIFTELLIQE